MIWSSMPLMTALDLVIVTIGSYALYLIIGAWPLLRTQGVSRTFLLLGAGILVLVSFFVLDLVSMYLLPMFYGTRTSMAFMHDLHLNWAWPAHLLTIAVISFGVRKYAKELLPTIIAQRRSLEERLAETSTKAELISQRHQLAISGSSDGFWYWQIGAALTWCSPRFAAFRRACRAQLRPRNRLPGR